METTIPLFPCKSLDTTLDFYQALGFEGTYRQDEPYLYAAVQRGNVVIHFSKLSVWSAKNAAALIHVPQIEPYFQAFSDGLREKFGRIPTAGLPRLTRLRPGHTRFHIFDPSGNVLLYINQDEEYTYSESGSSPLAQALDKAAFLRDTYANDKAAARVLDLALARHISAVPIERACALAARAELAVAMGDSERVQAVRAELAAIPLSDEDHARYRDELQAADQLECWLVAKPSNMRPSP